jgi:hypothetical protein
MNYTPVIIIGAGRSGTNMLRDIITSIPKFETWDCDEINPIWRYGNRDFKSDELTPENVTSKNKKYIRKKFQQLHNSTKADFIVEKTCANSLRLAFIYEIFPEAKYIIINRDGRDVVPSAMKRWVSKFELKYTLKKLRYVPLVDLFYYIGKFGGNRVKKVFSKSENLSFWGPIYKGIDEDVKNLTSLDVCAKQWKNCAENTNLDRALIPSQNIIDIKYEEFVENPIEQMKALTDFFGVKLHQDTIKKLTQKVSNKSVGSYKKAFSSEDQKKLNTLLKDTLIKLNYN